jgi:hypothetical protein
MKSVSMGTQQLVNSPSQSLAQLPRPVKLNDDAQAFTTAVQTNAQQQLPRVQCSGVYKRGAALLHYISIHPLHYRKMAQKRMDTKLTKILALLMLIVVTTTASASATPQKQEVIIAMEISFILSHS